MIVVGAQHFWGMRDGHFWVFCLLLKYASRLLLKYAS